MNSHFRTRMFMLVFMLIIFWGAGLYFNQLRIRDLQVAKKLNSHDLNVVLIVVSALRSDPLTVYGDQHPTTPYIDSLRERSIVFDNTVSSSSSSLPAIASLFTSHHPSEHTVHLPLIDDRQDGSFLQLSKIPDSITTIGELFYSGGFRTYGFSDNYISDRGVGFNRGFEVFETSSFKGARPLNSKVLQWHRELTTGDRYLLYINYTDLLYGSKQAGSLGTDHTAQLEAYSQSISNIDQNIQQLADSLGWEENALIIITSDYGTDFREHDGAAHGRPLYGEVIKVPLIIYHPRLPYPVQVEDFVHIIDIMPTLAELVDLPFLDNWRGESLLPLTFSSQPTTPKALYSELLLGGYPNLVQMRSVVLDGWQYVVSFEQNRLDPIATNLYNLREDVSQRHDLLKQKAPMAEMLAGKLKEFEQRLSGNVTEEFTFTIDTETSDKLRALGYLQ